MGHGSSRRVGNSDWAMSCRGVSWYGWCICRSGWSVSWYGWSVSVYGRSVSGVSNSCNWGRSVSMGCISGRGNIFSYSGGCISCRSCVRGRSIRDWSVVCCWGCCIGCGRSVICCWGCISGRRVISGVGESIVADSDVGLADAAVWSVDTFRVCRDLA